MIAVLDASPASPARRPVRLAIASVAAAGMIGGALLIAASFTQSSPAAADTAVHKLAAHSSIEKLTGLQLPTL